VDLVCGVSVGGDGWPVAMLGMVARLSRKSNTAVAVFFSSAGEKKQPAKSREIADGTLKV
jgi:hypothetical protein